MPDETDATTPVPCEEAGNRVEVLWCRFDRWISGPGGWSVFVRWVVAITLFGLAVGFLVFLSWLLRGAGLWGDLAFAIVVTTGVFWIARRVASKWLEEGPVKSLLRAFSTTIFVLVGVPIAWVTRPVGIGLLFLPIVVWAAFRIVDRWFHRLEHKPVFWLAEAVGVLLLGFVLLVAPSVGSVIGEPDLVPEADAAAGEKDAAVAERFRPLLFFDSGEVRFPLDVDDAIDEGRMQMCRKAVRNDDACERVEAAGDIDKNLDYVELAEAGGTPRGGDDRSAYYYHVVRENDRVYVDYWWFYSRNPSPVASKVFCGPGLRTPPFTCQEHVGDWEGLTVVLAPCQPGEEDCEQVGEDLLGPEEIRYGQHEHVVAYDWDELQGVWGALVPPGSPSLAEAWETFVVPAIDAAGARPLAFVARNSHASYPRPCFRNCEQQTRDLPEAPHNGAVPWANNAECSDCVQALPLTTEGEPALWNAFPGRWGAQECILAGAYCDLSGAPRGPSFQRRYQDPAGEVEEFCVRPTESGGIRVVRC
jgi:hypothetical protein